jgi:hypothetical protein
MQDTVVMADNFADSRRSALQTLLRPWNVLWAVLLLISAGLITYSETWGFVWDEGFHLVTAQLIAGGKSPYVDFIFPQTLLNAYFNAGVLRFVAYSWHAVHLFDALFVAGAVCLTATYVMRRFPDPRWRLPCALVAACFVGLNTVIIPFGPIAQAYGSGMLLVVAAFRVALRSITRATPWLAFLTSLLAGMAAGSTLLTAPVLPVLLLWILTQNRAGSRLAKFLVFCIGALLPFAPEIWLFMKSPQITFFNVVQYQALFRRVNWGDANSHDFDVFTDWSVSAHALLLGLLAIIGLFFLIRKSNWDRAVRREFYLAAWLSAALGAYISTAHPTFGRYFIFMIPLMAIVASAGFYYAASQLLSPERPAWPTAIILFILVISAAKYVFNERDATNWHDYEKIAAKIKEVTPPGQEYWADELVYFILRQSPPSGLEFSYSHKLDLSPQEEARYHIVSLKELKQQIAKGRFATVETCKDEIIDDFKLDNIFPNKQDFDDCTVFWRKTESSK